MSMKMVNPAPLGLAAFALTTAALSLFTMGILPKEGAAIVMPLAAAYGGLAQVLTGWWEAKCGNSFGFVAFTSYGAFWFYYAILNYLAAVGIVVVSPVAAGAVLVLWGFFTFYLWLATFKTNMAVFLVFLFLWVTFIVLGVGDITGIPVVTTSGGALAFVTAVAAWYASLSAIINESYQREILPVGRLRRA